MKLVIRDYWHFAPARPPVFPYEIAEGEPKCDPTVYVQSERGYQSVEEMQAELKRRFPTKVTLIPGGVRCEEGSYYQIITLEQALERVVAEAAEAV